MRINMEYDSKSEDFERLWNRVLEDFPEMNDPEDVKRFKIGAAAIFNQLNWYYAKKCLACLKETTETFRKLHRALP